MAEQPHWHPGQAVEVRYDIVGNDGTAVWGGAWHAGVVDTVADRTGAIKVNFLDGSTDKLDRREYGRMQARNALPRPNNAEFHRDSAALCAIYNAARAGANTKAASHAGSPWWRPSTMATEGSPPRRPTPSWTASRRGGAIARSSGKASG